MNDEKIDYIVRRAAESLESLGIATKMVDQRLFDLAANNLARYYMELNVEIRNRAVRKKELRTESRNRAVRKK